MAVIEVIIERWTNAKGETDYRWSVWAAGHRVHMGSTDHDNADTCETRALEFCWRALGKDPDKITRL